MEKHILNGDALKEQFPQTISGDIIVARECLVEGDVSGGDLNEFYKNRARFLEMTYGTKLGKYDQIVIPEFDKVMNLSSDTVVNLWFEDDLFCQVNLWFIAYLINKHTTVKQVYLIRPKADLQYGFGGMDQQALELAYNDRISLHDDVVQRLAQLWSYYRKKEYSSMLRIADTMQSELPLLSTAIQAHIDRYPNDGTLGRPQRSILRIMEDLGTDHFGKVFQAFNQRESIYGFGDLQVKRMFDEVNNKS